jgi:hypothetical protein
LWDFSVCHRWGDIEYLERLNHGEKPDLVGCSYRIEPSRRMEKYDVDGKNAKVAFSQILRFSVVEAVPSMARSKPFN